MPSPHLPTVGALVLAGGQASRMGGADKGLQIFHARALVDIAIERLQHQSPDAPQHIAISANRHLNAYRQRGLPVWSDEEAHTQCGPLAGFAAGLLRFQDTPFHAEYVLTVPCDSPGLPDDLLARLWTSISNTHAPVAVACTSDTDNITGKASLRQHNTVCLMHTKVLPSLQVYLRNGGRKISTWLESVGCVPTVFEAHNGDQAFANINTLEQLHALKPPGTPSPHP